jgi:HAE1 family hydrophobic/amphiphilic exporter-1
VNALNNNASQSNAGVMYVILKPWDARGKEKGQDLKAIYVGMSTALRDIQDVRAQVLLPPAIPGLGLSGGFQMQLMLTDGSNDFKSLKMRLKTFWRLRERYLRFLRFLRRSETTCRN